MSIFSSTENENHSTCLYEKLFADLHEKAFQFQAFIEGNNLAEISERHRLISIGQLIADRHYHRSPVNNSK